MSGKKFQVYLGTCEVYNADSVASIIDEALNHLTLGKPISGNVVIKPNLVMAHSKVATESFTRKEVVEGIIKTILKRGSEIHRIDIVEKSGLGITTAGAFRNAGYKKLRQYEHVHLRAMEERRRTTVVLEKGRVHAHISIASEMAERDFLIFAPKLKTNVLSHALSAALKLNIGTIDGKERIFQHHHKLHEKIVDILEAANPDLIVTDGVRFSYGGNQMTQRGTDLGVVVVAANAVAHDMVCAKLLNLDPYKIEHIKEAMDRGYGPVSFDEIEIMGDYPVERAQQVTRELDFGFMPVDRFKCNFTIKSGTPYCTGGCQGIFLDWLHMVKDRTPKRLERFPRLTVVLGKVEEKINAKRVILVGDCAPASPNVEAKRITRIKGCPPTHKMIILQMMLRHWLLAPMVLPSLILDGFGRYPIKKLKGWIANRKRKKTLKPNHNPQLPPCLIAQEQLTHKKETQ